MSKKIEALLAQTVDLSALDHETARYVENLRGMLEDAQREKAIVLDNRLGLHFSSKSYEERFDDWLDDAVVPVLDPELSRPEGDTGNLIIEGDNIDALRVMARTHKGKVDVVFIDPPYNTENGTFVYNDDYVAPEDKYRYSMWLEGLRRRLMHVPDLLSENGVLLVAINDKNRAYIEMLIKEQIMPGKFKGAIAWRSRSGKNEDGNANLSTNHEHVLVFANDGFSFGGGEKDYSSYKFNDHDGRGPYSRGDLSSPKTYRERPLTYYPIQDPETGVWYPANPDAVWRYATEVNLKPGQKLRKDTMENLIAANKIAFPREKRVHIWHTREELDAAIEARDVPVNGKGVPLLRAGLPNLDFFVGKPVGWGIPAYKRHLSEVKSETKPLSSWVGSGDELIKDLSEHTVLVSGLAAESNSELKSMFGEKVFDYAKPTTLLTGLLQQATQPDSIVLDFFGGSGTTAGAVLRLNAEDDGNRRFIMVSNTERSAKHPDKNLCRDVLRPRINSVMDGFTAGKKEIEGTGGGYAYLRMERHSDESICGPLPFALTIDMAFTLCQIAFGIPVEALDVPASGYVVRETEDAVLVFAPEWSKTLTDAVKAEFEARADKDHVLISDRDQTPTAHLRAAGCESAKCLDAIVFAGRLCGPAAFFKRSV